MHIQVLGSAAGGGFPQWNCNCHNCAGVRQGSIQARPRSQSSIAISTNGEDWLLFNASPDIRSQIEAFPPLQPSKGLRGSGIKAVVLMDSQLDHSTGLLFLREGCPLPVWCTEMVKQDLNSGFPVFPILEAWNGGLSWHPIAIGSELQPFHIPEFPLLRLTAIPLRSSAPPYSPHRHDPHRGDNIGLFIEDIASGGSLLYAPGLGEISAELRPWFGQADCVLVDGTLWQEDELIVSGVGDKLGTAMGHLPQSGPNGMLAFLDTLEKPRKVLIHINNTNPILNEQSPERAILAEHQVEVAYDGMQILL